ncbi:MAG: hydrogenase maturation protease [Candidatus Heimdallarchaeota archaeon]|nr:hydrogenase maturation protease [Candidatus Heimdallarchaeota archaeon]
MNDMIVIGLGNIYRQDDAIGILASQLLSKRFNFRCYNEEEHDIDEIILNLEESDIVIFIDAADFCDYPGESQVISSKSLIKPISTHQAQISSYVTLLESRGIEVKIFIIQVGEIGFHKGLTEELKKYFENKFIDDFRNSVKI